MCRLPTAIAFATIAAFVLAPPVCVTLLPATALSYERVIELDLSFETTSDWASFSFDDLQVHVLKRRLDIDGGGYIRSDGGFLAKSSYDTRRVALTAKLRAIITGPKPRLVLSKGNAGKSRFILRSGNRILVDIAHEGVVKGDDKNRRFAALGPQKLASLPTAKLRHFPRLALAFYYGWYGTPTGPSGRWRHWNPAHKHHDSLNRPVGGWYDSLDPVVVDRHCRQARAAGLDGLILSWWNDAKRNQKLLDVLQPAALRHGLKVSVYIESATTPRALRAELKRLMKGPAQHKSWLHADGKPVFFLYTRVLGKLTRRQLLSATVGLGAFIVGDTLVVNRLGDFDALHTYYMARKTERYRQRMFDVRRAATLAGKRLIATVMPGYNDSPVRNPGFVRPRDNMAFLRRCFRAAMGADWLLLTSFNEWHEGSEIEPSVEHADRYLRRFANEVQRWKIGP